MWSLGSLKLAGGQQTVMSGSISGSTHREKTNPRFATGRRQIRLLRKRSTRDGLLVIDAIFCSIPRYGQIEARTESKCFWRSGPGGSPRAALAKVAIPRLSAWLRKSTQVSCLRKPSGGSQPGSNTGITGKVSLLLWRSSAMSTSLCCQEPVSPGPTKIATALQKLRICSSLGRQRAPGTRYQRSKNGSRCSCRIFRAIFSTKA